MYLATYYDYDYTDSSKSTASQATESSFGINEILLIIVMILLAISIVLVIISLVKITTLNRRINNVSIKIGNIESGNTANSLGVVFCKKCGSNFNSTESKCPFCGEKKL